MVQPTGNRKKTCRTLQALNTDCNSATSPEITLNRSINTAVTRSLTRPDRDQPRDDPAVGVGRPAPHRVLPPPPRSVAAVQRRAGTAVTVAGKGQNVQRTVVKAPETRYTMYIECDFKHAVTLYARYIYFRTHTHDNSLRLGFTHFRRVAILTWPRKA